MIRGLAALAEGVGGHDDELLRQLSALLLFVVAGGGGADGLGHALLTRLQPLVLQTVFGAGAAPVNNTQHSIKTHTEDRHGQKT